MRHFGVKPAGQVGTQAPNFVRHGSIDIESNSMSSNSRGVDSPKIASAVSYQLTTILLYRHLQDIMREKPKSPYEEGVLCTLHLYRYIPPSRFSNAKVLSQGIISPL